MIDPYAMVIYILGPLFLIQLKHQAIDWMWQPAYEYENKGTWLHFGGIRHALKNAIGTALSIGIFFGGPIGLMILCLDFVIHYLIDYCKVNINRHYKLDPKVHKEYFWLLGLDQTLHQLTYLFLLLTACYLKFG